MSDGFYDLSSPLDGAMKAVFLFHSTVVDVLTFSEMVKIKIKEEISTERVKSPSLSSLKSPPLRLFAAATTHNSYVFHMSY